MNSIRKSITFKVFVTCHWKLQVCTVQEKAHDKRTIVQGGNRKVGCSKYVQERLKDDSCLRSTHRRPLPRSLTHNTQHNNPTTHCHRAGYLQRTYLFIYLIHCCRHPLGHKTPWAWGEVVLAQYGRQIPKDYTSKIHKRRALPTVHKAKLLAGYHLAPCTSCCTL